MWAVCAGSHGPLISSNTCFSRGAGGGQGSGGSSRGSNGNISYNNSSSSSDKLMSLCNHSACSASNSDALPGTTRSSTNEVLWQRFLQNPSQWWDYRFTKTDSRFPDFVHNATKDKLWIDELEDLPWLRAALVEENGLEGVTAWEPCCKGLFYDSSNIEAFRKLCENGRLSEAIWFAVFMQKHGLTISIAIFHCLLDGCVKQQNLAASREVYCLVSNSDIKSSSSITRKLIHTYASCGSLVNANQVFEAVSEPDVFMWTAIISAHARFGEGEQAIALYHKMKQTSVKPDGHLFVAVFQACAKAGALSEGELFHADAVEGGFEQIVFVSNSLINMYAKCERLEGGCIVFNRLIARDAVSWNSMMTGLLQQCLDGEALQLAVQMQEEGIDPSPVTLVCSLKACTSLNALVQGKLVHARAIFLGLESDLFVGSTLIDMYVKCGDLDCAKIAFLRRQEHSLVMWNVLIAGYAMHGQCKETSNLLQQMCHVGLKPNNVTWNVIITAQVQHGHAEAALRSIEDMQSNGMELDNATTVSLLSACSSIADLEKGMKIHQSFLSRGCEPDVIVGCSLINMYAKCGNIESARRVFDEWPVRNMVTWNAIIAGYAQHGECQVAAQLFYQMLEEGIRPDHITWNTLIMGYAQHGHSQEAIQLFEKMKRSGLDPDLDTYSSVLKACHTAAFIETGRMIHVDMYVLSRILSLVIAL